MAEINCSQGFDTIILIQTGLLFERRLPWILLAETYHQDIKQHLVNKLRVSVVVKITLIFVRSNKTGGGDRNINKKADEGTRLDEFPVSSYLLSLKKLRHKFRGADVHRVLVRGMSFPLSKQLKKLIWIEFLLFVNRYWVFWETTEDKILIL